MAGVAAQPQQPVLGALEALGRNGLLPDQVVEAAAVRQRLRQKKLAALVASMAAVEAVEGITQVPARLVE